MKLFLPLLIVVIFAQATTSANETAVPSPTTPTSPTSSLALETAVQAHDTDKTTTYCKDCVSESRKEYETCTEKNNYFQESLHSFVTAENSNYAAIREGHFVSESEFIKTENCIRESMRLHAGPFRQCDQKDQGLAKDRVAKACMNSDYVQTTTDSFIAVTDCFSGFLAQPETQESDDSVRRGLFSLISYESGFHTNAVSGTGSIGIGQFTTDTIRGVNKMVLDDILSYAKASSKPSCKAIAKQEIRPYSAVYKNRCEVISPREGNPLKNLIYVVGIQKLNRQSFEKTLTVLPQKTRAAIENATPEFREKLINMMVNWSHNTGIGGVRLPFINFATSKRGQELIAKEDLNSFAKEMAPMIGNFHSNYLLQCPEDSTSIAKCEDKKKARVSEVTQFYKGIVDRQGIINDKMGNSGGDDKCGV